MPYPSSIDSHTNVSGTTTLAGDDHAARHNTIGSAIVNIENTLGTTAGTALLTAFTSSDKPLRMNASDSGTLQQTISKGTINNAVLGTPSVTGGTLTNVSFPGTLSGLTLGTPTILGANVTSGTLGTVTLTAPLLQGTITGWVAFNETLTYASGTSVTIVGDRTDVLSVGDKVKFTQTTEKQFYVASVAAASGTTTLGLAAGTNYTVANAAITTPYYSKAASPQGFLHWFGWTPTWSGFSTDPTGGTHLFAIVGRTAHVTGSGVTAGTSNGAGLTINNLPVAAGQVQSAVAAVVENGSNQFGLITTTANSGTLTAFSNAADAAFTASGQKSIRKWAISYTI